MLYLLKFICSYGDCIFSVSDIGKVWRTESDVAWRTDHSFKRMSPLNASCATTTTPPTSIGTTVATGGGAPAHPHLSPSIAAPVTTPDHRSGATLQAKQGISPGMHWNKKNPLHLNTSTIRTKIKLIEQCSEWHCNVDQLYPGVWGVEIPMTL